LVHPKEIKPKEVFKAPVDKEALKKMNPEEIVD